ncbi:hypothetical protein INT45_009811 [Circinella minor]|uniref:Reverse transcriptase domain-containing protein n=1 Tax=Circinella minor TaxID=1195481 RepID=A0A8H7VMW9_9FUNG|nr:hypothetical protein INT45_009811 [Circinella minor]
MDDLLIMAKSAHQAQQHTTLIAQKLQELGWLLNNKKSQLIPTQDINHLGMCINTKTMTISIPGKKIRTLRRNAYQLLHMKTVSWTKLAQFIGSAIATQLGNQQARFRTRHLLKQLNRTRNHITAPITALMQ